MIQAARPAVVAGRLPSGVFTRDHLKSDTVIDADVVVVGSGAGGATMAAELAEEGFDVVVVEEGRFFSSRDFTAEASAMVRALYRNGGATAAMGKPPVAYQEGRAVGGSTVINGGMSWRTPERILERWVKEDGLDGLSPAAMEAVFQRVERRIHVRSQDASSIGLDNELLRRGAQAKGWRVVENLRNQVHCPGSNNCAFGCPTGAKQSALVTYIPRALHFGARVYSDVRVERITWHGKRATGVVGRVVNPDLTSGPRVHVRAKVVVSACGAVNTPALLLRSGLRSPSRQLGQNLSLHPNCKMVAIFDQPVRGWEGVHQAYQVREFEDQGMVFAAVNVPPSILGMTLEQHGAELGELMSQYDRMLVAGLLIEDTARGRVRVGPLGNPVVTYQLTEQDVDTLVRGMSLLAELLFAAGATRVLLPVDGIAELRSADDARRLRSCSIDAWRMEVVTVHLMGTARMGSDRTRAVTDGFGQVYDTDRLIVSDASLFPTAIGVNPMETIQALATRNAAHIIDERRRYLS